MDQELYDAQGVGHLLGLSARTIKRWREHGKFPEPAIVIGDFVRWTKDQIMGWIREKEEETKDGRFEQAS